MALEFSEVKKAIEAFLTRTASSHAEPTIGEGDTLGDKMIERQVASVVEDLKTKIEVDMEMNEPLREEIEEVIEKAIEKIIKIEGVIEKDRYIIKTQDKK